MENFRLLTGKSDGTSFCSTIYDESRLAFIDMIERENYIETTIFPSYYQFNGKNLHVSSVSYYFDKFLLLNVYRAKIEYKNYICDITYHKI